MTTQTTFGEYVKQLRVDARLTLRKFCELVNYDCANWSKIERGVLPVPANEGLFCMIANVLNLKGAEYQAFIDRAMFSRGELPRDITENEYIMEALPAFVCTVREIKPSREELESLIEFLRNDYRKMKKP